MQLRFYYQISKFFKFFRYDLNEEYNSKHNNLVLSISIIFCSSAIQVIRRIN